MRKFKFTGDGEILIRDVLFPAGQGVEVNDELAAKLANLDYFAEVKRGRKPKDDQDPA